MSTKLPSSTTQIGQISTTKKITMSNMGIIRIVVSVRSSCLLLLRYLVVGSLILIIIPNNKLISHKLVTALLSLVILHTSTAICSFLSLDLYSSLLGTPENLHYKYITLATAILGNTKLITVIAMTKL